MTPEEAVGKLRGAGLYVKDLGENGSFFGGGWREVVDSITMVRNAFVLIPLGNEIYDVGLVADCQRDMKRHMALEEAVDFLIKNVELSPMTHERAIEKLREAGLHVRDLRGDGIIGGSHIDRSGVVGMIQNGFMLRKNPEGLYWVDLENGTKVTLPLEEAVAVVLMTITPQPNIEAPPPSPGYQEY